MLCEVCRDRLEGIWDPSKTQRIALWPSSDLQKPMYKRTFRDIQDRAALLEAEQDPQGIIRFLYGHHASEDTLERSKRQGCAVCSKMEDREAGGLDSFGYCTTFCIEINSTYRRAETGFVMSIYGNNMCGGQHVYFAPYPPRIQFLHDNLTKSTEHSATWDIVESWLSTCVRTHEACAITSEYFWVPTRLLKLDAANNTFQLVSQKNVEHGSRYAALSHCWGPTPCWNPKLILNRENHDALCKQQPVDELPRTFRDAFTIIQRLDLQYLWIDRLCILQDSKEDWEKEASMMHNVYRNSFMCISALSAANDDGGCFFDRKLEVVKPTIIGLPKDGPGQHTLYTSYEDDNLIWKNTFSQEVLTSRAWVVQERLLAPRTLHFGKDQIYWECNQEFRCETQPEHEWRRVEAVHRGGCEIVSKFRTTWKALIGQNSPLVMDPNLALRDEWFNTVRLYSSCKLTKEEDKLVAISAVAKDMKRQLELLGKPIDYVAGIWGLWLPQSLLWWIEPKTAQKQRPRQYRAPSWSWASLNSTLVPPYAGRTFGVQIASVKSVGLTHLTDDDTGQIVGGALTLRGKLVRVRLERRTKQWDGWCLVNSWLAKRAETLEGDSLRCTDEHDGHIVFDTEEDVSQWVCFLPIFAFGSHRNCDGFYEGLLLASSGSDYRRVGHMDTILHRTLEEIEDREVRIV